VPGDDATNVEVTAIARSDSQEPKLQEPRQEPDRQELDRQELDCQVLDCQVLDCQVLDCQVLGFRERPSGASAARTRTARRNNHRCRQRRRR